MALREVNDVGPSGRKLAIALGVRSSVRYEKFPNEKKIAKIKPTNQYFDH